MFACDQFNQAVAAHNKWKQRLREAITKGKSEFAPEAILADNICDLGKWLYALKAPFRDQPIYEEIRAVHAEFHQEAAKIMGMALKKQKKAALTALNSDGLYASLTTKLLFLLNQWCAQLQENPSPPACCQQALSDAHQNRPPASAGPADITPQLR